MAWVAPKNKVYSSTESLRNRTAVCLGINGLGTYEYYKLLFERLNILPMPSDVDHYLQAISKNRSKKLAQSKTAAFKKKRQAKYQMKLLAKTVVAKCERAKREGTYKKGMGINGGYTEEELQKAKELFPSDYVVSKAAAKKAATQCKFCQRFGHATNRSKECSQHAAWLERKNNVAAVTMDDDDDDDDTPEGQLLRDAEECNLMDQLPLDEDDDEDDEILEMYDVLLSDLGKDEEEDTEDADGLY